MLTVEAFFIDQNIVERSLALKEIFREGRALVGRPIVGGDDAELAGFEAVVHHLLCCIAGHHAAAQNDIGIGIHGVRSFQRDRFVLV